MKNNETVVTIGTSQDPDPIQAGQHIAQMVKDQLANQESIGWALAFCGGRHNASAILEALRAQFDQADIVGGAAVGTITNDSLGYGGYECSVAAFSDSIPKPELIVVEDLAAGETEAGRQLGSRLRDRANDGDTVLLFYDSLQSGPPPVLYVGSRLVDGLYEGLAGKELNLIGAGTIGDYQFVESYIFDGSRAVKHAAVAVILPSILKSHTIIMHGCIPVSSFIEITRLEGPVVYELDGRPALELLTELSGQELDGSMANNLSLTLTLGKKYGDLYAPYDESAYVNRLIIGANPEDGSVTIFEADFQVGDKVQVMSRDNRLMAESVQRRTRELLDATRHLKPILAFYIDCAGRSRAFSGAEVEEAGILQAELGNETPLLGFYSGVEIAPLLGRSRPLDWTGVLTLLSLEDEVGR